MTLTAASNADLHTVNVLLVMRSAIDIPGCVGLIPVFIDVTAAELYRDGLDNAGAYTVSRWGVAGQEEEKPA